MLHQICLIKSADSLALVRVVTPEDSLTTKASKSNTLGKGSASGKPLIFG